MDTFRNGSIEDIGSGIENPCVGGSIPPQATKVYLAKKPTHAVGFFVSGDEQSSRPVHFRAAAFFGKLPPLLPLPKFFRAWRACLSMFRADTTGTPTRAWVFDVPVRQLCRKELSIS